MDDRKEDKLLDHNYDGIQEYDNSLPGWWVKLFWGCIVFGVIYVFLFHVGDWKFDAQKLDENMANLDALRESAKQASRGNPAEEGTQILALVSDAVALERGKVSYVAKCAACHLDGGQGLVGPNLTDDYWIHGGTVADIKRVIVEGIPEKGMLAWGTLMSDAEINEVTAYVWALHGTNPPNPKEPQGDLSPRD